MSLSKNELLSIEGGAISAAYLTAIVRGVNALLDLGRSLGTAIRRVIAGSIC